MNKISFFWIILLFVNSLLGQKNPYPEVSIASPTAAALGKYGDIPVNYHTGIPEVNIPLYTISEGPLKLPVSLSYQGGGVKLLETASWVGLGWTLNAGGVITRTVQGAPDEKNTSNVTNQAFGHFSDYGFTNYLYKDIAGNPISYQDWADFADGHKDGEPDLFFFNFNGYTGKFYLSDDRTPVVIPQQDLKIEYTYSTGASIQSFTITTPDGVKYIFGNSTGTVGAPPVETTNSWTKESGMETGTVISSWFLNKIQSADGLFSISLQYASENYGYYVVGTHPVEPTSSDPGCYIVKNIISGVRLSKIISSNGEVDFIANTVRTDLSTSAATAVESGYTTAKCLDKIQIKNSIDFCKEFDFSYSYFTDASDVLLPSTFLDVGFSISTDKKRLRLDNVNEKNCNNAQAIPPYTFTYSSVNLPRRLCFAQDHWGFNNGQINNSTLIPTYRVFDGSTSDTHYGANRDANEAATPAASLTKIKYPTGGTTTFDWESNYVNSNTSTSNYLSGNSMRVYMDGNPDFTQTTVITVTDASHPMLITINNTSTYGATFDVKDHSTHNLIAHYSISFGSPDNESLYISTGTYDCILTLPPQAEGGCTGSLSYNWGTTVNYQNVAIGGIRIKTLTTSDGNNSANDIITNYSYNSPGGQSTGVLYNIPAYAQIVRNDLIAKVGYWTTGGFTPNTLSPQGCATGGSPSYYISPGNVQPLSSVQGSHVGYSLVTVSQAHNGYSTYHYYTTSHGYGQTSYPYVASTDVDVSFCYATTPNYPAAPLPFDFKRGELYYEEHFDNTDYKLKDIYYTPYFDTVSVPATPVFVVATRNFGYGIQYLGTFDSMHTVRKDSVLIVEDDYDKTGGMLTTQKTKYFGSKYHNEITRETTINSKKETVESLYKYAFDFRISSCDNVSCLTNYSSACSSCQDTYNTARGNCDYNDKQCLTTAYTAFLQCQNNARINYVSCQKTNFTNPNNSYQTCHTTAKNGANDDLKPILEMQDEYINTPIEISNWKNNLLISSQFNKDTIDASGNVYIKRVQKINLTAPSASFSSATVNGTGLTKDNRYQDETTINFKLGNIRDVTEKTGIKNTFLWNYNNNLPIATVINAASSQVAYTSFETDGQGNWVYSGTPSIDATAPTGQYVYSLNPNGTPANITCSVVLDQSQRYIVSYWSKGSSYDVQGGVTNGTTTGKSINGWTYYEHLITGVTSTKVKFPTGGSGAGKIDEVRLYPENAQMTTYTYTPLIGMTSQCDVNNKITYYEYDGLGRLDLIRDQDKNIIKKYCYNYAGQVTNCNVAMYYNKADTVFLTKTCPTGQTGTVPIPPYVISAGTFTSTESQDAADQKAQADAAANAQTYTNTYGKCITTKTVAVTCARSGSSTPFTIQLTNLKTNQQYAVSLDASTSTGTVYVPAGSYNILCSGSGITTPFSYSINYNDGAIYTSGTSALIYNIVISDYASITISNLL